MLTEGEELLVENLCYKTYQDTEVRIVQLLFFPKVKQNFKVVS